MRRQLPALLHPALLLAALLLPAMSSHSGPGAQEPEVPQATARPAQDQGQDRILTDFADDGWRWATVLDGVMGGRSDGSFLIADGVLRFTGMLDTNGGGFASLRSADRALDLTGFTGVRLRVRGDGRTYQMRIRQRGLRDGVSYRAEFQAGSADVDPDAVEVAPWQDVWLPFSAFEPAWRGRRLDLPALDPRAIEGLGLTIADGIDGPFQLQARSIAAYAPFDLDQLLWRNRPLVVCAPEQEMPEAAAWRNAFEQALADCRDRDMVLIQLYENGTSRIANRVLERGEVVRLRARLAVETGAFRALLIGKDGGVKRRFDGAPKMGGLFATIDAMPMRREEVARRKGRDN